ncbi:MAG: VCBS repeat-containing protein [bacterium]|nr:VCBS repeat-containing protein [bacterium]
MTCLATLGCLALLALPQGPKLESAAATSTLEFPDRPEQMAHTPFVDALGVPTTADLLRFGTVDLDGNHVADAFWLGDTGHGPELRLAMGREHCPGRFRDWPIALRSLALTDAAPLRQAWLDQDTLLLADPAAQYLTRLTFDLGTGLDPHTSGAFATAAFGALPPMLGAIELATNNVEGDGCDDIAVVYDRGAAGHAIIKYELDAPFGIPLLVRSTRADLPWAVRHVQLADFNGDGRSDVAAELPGLGVLIGTDDLSGQLQYAGFVPYATIDHLCSAPFGTAPGTGAALALTTATGVLVCWFDGPALRYHWLTAQPGTATGSAALLPRGDALEVVAFGSDGRTLQIQAIQRGRAPGPIVARSPHDPAAYLGLQNPCGLATADVDADGDVDLVLQHPDGIQWYTVRHEHTALRPALVDLSQDLALASLGWYGATYEVAVPAHWDFVALPQIELQVMVEHPFTGDQLRWDRRILPIDPLTRCAKFTVQWQDSAQHTAAFLNNPALVPPAFTQAGHLTAGRRSQLTFLGFGLGNVSYPSAERRTEPLILFTDPGGNGNKSAQGVVWEKRAAPPLPKADAALLPWQ